MKIKVLGPGCGKCHQLEKTVKDAVSELGIDAKNLDTLQRQCMMFNKIEQGPVKLTGEDITRMFSEVL